MALFVEAVKTAVRFTRCQLLNAEAFIAGGAGLLPSGSRNTLLDAVNRQRRLLGCTGPDIDEPDPPFTGGQCPVAYTATGTYDLASKTTGQVLIPNQSFGPISIIGPVQGFVNSVAGPDDVLRVEGATGFEVVRSPTFRPIGRTLNLVRQDSLPDNCGSVPPNYPPPTNIDVDIDIDYDDDDGNPINITIPFIFAPIKVNFDGSLRIPFSFDFGGFTFDGSIDLSPEFDVDINLPPLPRGDGQGLDSIEAGDPGDEVDPIETQEKIIGVVVTSEINSQSNLTNIATQNMPNIVAPRLGSVKFAYSLGATTFWSNDIDIKGQRVFIPCPFSQGADAAVASPVPGVSLSFVEIRGFPLATNNDVSRAG